MSNNESSNNGTTLLFYQKTNYHKEAQWLQIQCISKAYLGSQKVFPDFLKKEKPLKELGFSHGKNFDRNIFQQLKTKQFFFKLKT